MPILFQRIYDALMHDEGYKLILGGLATTLLISAMAVIIGTILGTIIGVTKVYSNQNKYLKILNVICDTYITVIRGIPVLIQLLIMYNIIFVTATSKHAVLFVAVIAFGINSSAYVAEIIRSGISSIDMGQREAGIALGLDEFRTMMLIIIPQAIKNILPALFNEFIALVKETAVAGYIGIMDLTKVSDIIKSKTYEPSGPLVIIAILYFVIVAGLTHVLKHLERRMRKHDRR